VLRDSTKTPISDKSRSETYAGGITIVIGGFVREAVEIGDISLLLIRSNVRQSG
jgi:hypothetical protein